MSLNEKEFIKKESLTSVFRKKSQRERENFLIKFVQRERERERMSSSSSSSEKKRSSSNALRVLDIVRKNIHFSLPA